VKGVVEGRFGAESGRAPAGTSPTYAIRLDRDAPRPAVIRDAAAHNPFTPGELERVLRPYDPDAATLPPRLAAILDDRAERVRMLVTTDSWDTAGKTGRAARDLQQPELRFDLNRPLPDDAAKQQYYADLFAVVTAAGAPATPRTRQWVANVVDFRDEDDQQTTFGGGGQEEAVQGAEPPADGRLGSWNRGTFVSVAELLAIPPDSKAAIDEKLANREPLVSLVIDHPAILEAVMVTSRFQATIAADPWREPGRVNVNTCDDKVWEAVCGTDDVDRPQRPMRSMWDLLRGAAMPNGQDVQSLERDLANRLASVATVRSNVFAVWITVEITDSAATAAPPSMHRMFAIVDRSIPVEYAVGENRNVRDTIRVRRFLD